MFAYFHALALNADNDWRFVRKRAHHSVVDKATHTTEKITNSPHISIHYTRKNSIIHARMKNTDDDEWEQNVQQLKMGIVRTMTLKSLDD